MNAVFCNIGFWSPEWEQQVNPQSGGQGTKKKLVIKKAAPKPVAATTGSEQRSTAQPAAKAQKPRNPMEELKGFNMSKLKRVVPKKEAPAASSAAPTNALVAALNDFHKKKATASAASQSHAPVETPVVQQTALKPSVTTPKPLSALDELKMFDRSKLKSAGNGTEAVSEDQPSQPTVSGSTLACPSSMIHALLLDCSRDARCFLPSLGQHQRGCRQPV